MNIKQKSETFIAPTYKRADLVVEHGDGSLLFSEDGKRYIDLGSGIAVNTFGVADKIWQEAIKEQIGKVQHTSNLYYTAPQSELAKLLCERSGMKRVFFGNSGAEANECAIKAARKYSSDKYGEGRHIIVTLKGSFHGRTLTTLSATGQDSFHTHFGPFTEGFVHVEPNNKDELCAVFDKYPCAAFMAELIQGESGIIELDADYVKFAYNLCKERDILFIADEVQTGNGRTGKLYSYMHYDILPDIVSTAKGLAGGLPFGATLFGEKCENTLSAGTHGSTFGGNPVCAAAAKSTLERIDDGLMKEVSEKGEYIKKELSGADGVLEVSGRGLMLGIRCEKASGDIAAECLKRGVIVLTAHEKVRLLPALNIPMELLAEAISILKDVIK